jgi:dihydrofolate reductase
MARRVILFIATSLDNYIAGPAGEIDWLFTDQDYGYTPFLAGVDTLLMGRKSYELCLTLGPWAWPGRTTYVFSRSRAGEATEHARFTAEPPAELVARLRAEPGRHLWLLGGGELNAAFFAAGLVDEVVISIHPLLLGAGIALASRPIPRQQLALRTCETFPTGLVQLTYDVRH